MGSRCGCARHKLLYGQPGRVYLAGPINEQSDSEAMDWRDLATEVLAPLGFGIINPMDRDYRGMEMEDGIAVAIVKGDKEDVRDCTIVLAYCPLPSAGTSMEIFYAHSLGKYVISVVPDIKKTSPWIAYHSGDVVTSLSKAFSKLSERFI